MARRYPDKNEHLARFLRRTNQDYGYRHLKHRFKTILAAENECQSFYDDDIAHEFTGAICLYEKAKKTILTDRQIQAVELMFFQDMTLKQAGKIMGVTGDRVRQILEKTFRKIRSHTYAHNKYAKFKDHL